MNELTQDLIGLSNIPRVPFWAQLAGGLVMAGWRLIPTDLMPRVATRVAQAEDAYAQEDALVEAGWTKHYNHSRGDAHEYWQSRLAEETGLNPDECWVIPLDEMICAGDGDDAACDFIGLTRLIFCGSEQEMRDSLAEWLS